MAINLSKITLARPNESAKLSLEKFGGDLKVALRWNSGGAAPKKKGWLASVFGGNKGNQEIDLDLGVYLEMANGHRLIIDPLQAAFQTGNRGKLDAEPWVHHSGDDRSGGGGEVLMVSGKNLANIKRMVLYTFIYEGAASWSKTDARIHIEPPSGQALDIVMGAQSDNRVFCALAEVTVDGASSIDVRRLMSFHTGHEDCDKTYNWGFQWKSGSK